MPFKQIYCPVTLKSVSFGLQEHKVYYDYQNKTWKSVKTNNVYKESFESRFTENNIYYDGTKLYEKTKPFNVSQEDLNFLRSSERLEN